MVASRSLIQFQAITDLYAIKLLVLIKNLESLCELDNTFILIHF